MYLCWKYYVKISCFRAKAQLVFHLIWRLYNKRNNWSEQAIRDVPTYEHKLAQILARLNGLQGGFNKLCNGFGWIHLQHMRMVVAFAAGRFLCF